MSYSKQRQTREATREFCYGKIHRCVVTQAELDYVGSITVDPALLRASRIYPHTKVEVVNITRKDAARIMTYVIEGPENSGVVCLNGAAAHHFSPGDLAIIMAYESVPVSLISQREHITVQVNGENGICGGNTNRIVDIKKYLTPSFEGLGMPENNRFGESYVLKKETALVLQKREAI
ncbi:MAG: aspartate 1-decarboxylase [Alphaproteobacteria bacterium]|nr:aspartate 1-decarboxylase [Alphaproteobacteria bacterium]